MSDRYELTTSEDGLTYQFTTDFGEQYIAYFTEFTLRDFSDMEFMVPMFGFEPRNAGMDKGKRIFDRKIKNTIQYIIQEFFTKNPENSILYLCSQEDEKARQRKVTFSGWFQELDTDTYIKCDSPKELSFDKFYCSIILLKDNPNKDYLISAFYYTINYWMGT